MAHRIQIRNRRASAKRGRDDEYERRHCTSKSRMTHAQALRQAAKITLETGYKNEAYRCRYKDHWHVGRVRVRLPSGIVTFEKVI